MNSVQPNTAIRVRAKKGFFAVVQGQYGIVNPGDVVDLDRQLAAMMFSSQKAEPVDAGTQTLRVQNYLPERLKNPPIDPQVERLDKLQATVESLAQAVATLVTGQAAAAKSKEK